MKTYLSTEEKDEYSEYEASFDEQRESIISHISNSPYSCVSCFHRISNPVCVNCYAKHLRMWISDKPIEKKIKKQIIGRAIKATNSDFLNETNCVICGNQDAALCTYCFFFKVENILSKFDLPGEVILDFEDTFNYKIFR